MENKIKSYRDLIVWQKAMELSISVFEVTENFPKEEKYGLAAHLRKTAVSIPSNIAEGSARGTRKDYAQFIRIAYGSGAELETQIEIAKRWRMTAHQDFSEVDKLLLEVMKMLNKLVHRLAEQFAGPQKLQPKLH